MYRIAYNIKVVEPVELDKVHPRTKSITLEEFIDLTKHDMLYTIIEDYLIIEIPTNIDHKQAQRYIHAELSRYYWDKVARKEYRDLIDQLERN